MFIGRKKELSLLEDGYNDPSSRFQIVYGQKNSGKTALLNQFLKDKKRLYFSSYEMIPSLFFTQMANKISQYFYQTPYIHTIKSFEEVLILIQKAPINEKLILVFDDFNKIINVDKDALDQLLYYWKKRLSKKNIDLIISSSIQFDKKIVCDEILLESLPFTSLNSFFPTLSKLDQLYLYSLLGTSPKYLKFYNTKKDFTQNLYNLFLSQNGYLSTLGIDLLKSELADIGTYGSILYAIAQGNTKIGDIALALDLKSTYLTRYIQKLLNMMIIKKIVPINEDKQKSKYGRYIICDNAIKFWFCYIYTNMTSLKEMDYKVVTKLIQDSFVTQTIALNYKEAVKEYIYLNQEKIFGYKPISIGSWWDNSDNMIDIVAYDRKTITFVQVYWEDKDMAKIQYGDLKRISEKFNSNLQKKYIIITKESLFNIH
jgi:AAA+ ATPase superfamily predicted ATPase